MTEILQQTEMRKFHTYETTKQEINNAASSSTRKLQLHTLNSTFYSRIKNVEDVHIKLRNVDTLYNNRNVTKENLLMFPNPHSKTI